MAANDTNGTVDEGIAWEHKIWLTNRFLVWDLVRVFGLSIAISILLIGVMGLIVESEFVTIPLYGWGIVIGTLALLYFITIAIMGLRWRAVFSVTPRGVSYQPGSGEKGALKSVVAIGSLAGSATTAGAGLLATAADGATTEWRDVHKVVAYRGAGAIVVRNTWRAVQRLWASPELYDSVLQAIREYWAASGGDVEVVEK